MVFRILAIVSLISITLAKHPIVQGNANQIDLNLQGSD